MTDSANQRYIVTHTDHDTGPVWYVKDTHLIPDGFSLYVVARCSSRQDAETVAAALNDNETLHAALAEVRRDRDAMVALVYHLSEWKEAVLRADRANSPHYVRLMRLLGPNHFGKSWIQAAVDEIERLRSLPTHRQAAGEQMPRE